MEKVGPEDMVARSLVILSIVGKEACTGALLRKTEELSIESCLLEVGMRVFVLRRSEDEVGELRCRCGLLIERQRVTGSKKLA